MNHGEHQDALAIGVARPRVVQQPFPALGLATVQGLQEGELRLEVGEPLTPRLGVSGVRKNKENEK